MNIENQLLQELAQSIRESIPDLLGSYTFPGGGVVPAIAVESRVDPPSGTKIQGLEILLVQVDESRQPTAGTGMLTRYEIKMAMKWWGDGSTPNNMLNARNRIYNLPGVMEVNLRSQDRLEERDGVVEVAEVQIVIFIITRKYRKI